MADKKKILIIEDDRVLTKMVKMRIEGSRETYEVLLANDGETGLKMADQHKPDLIVLDVNLPRKGGLEICRALATKEGKLRVPVLVLTARGELKDFFKDLEVDGFICKPFDAADLLKEVDRIMVKHDSSFVPFKKKSDPIVKHDDIFAGKEPPKPPDPTGLTKL